MLAPICGGNVGGSSHYGGDPIFSLKNWPFERGSDTGPTEIAVTSTIKLRKIITRKRRSIPSQDRRLLCVPGLF
jgi:hypothetical protein